MSMIELKVTLPVELFDLSQEIRGVNEEHLGTLTKSNREQTEARKWERIKCSVASQEHYIELNQFDTFSYIDPVRLTFQISEHDIYHIRSNLFELELPAYLSETFKPVLQKTVGVAHDQIFKQVAAAVQAGDKNFYVGGTYVTQINIDVKYDSRYFYARTLDGFYVESKVSSTDVQSTLDMLYNLFRCRTIRNQNMFRQYKATLNSAEKIKVG